jgi:hypothetical protein
MLPDGNKKPMQRHQWLQALHPNAVDKVEEQMNKSEGRISMYHWAAKDLWRSERGIHLRAEAVPRPVPLRFPDQALLVSTAEHNALLHKCICTQSEEVCGEEVVTTGETFAAPSQSGRAKAWLRALRQGASVEEIESVLVETGGKFIVAAHHFRPSEITVMKNRHGESRRPQLDATPRFTPYSPYEMEAITPTKKYAARKRLTSEGGAVDKATVTTLAAEIAKSARLTAQLAEDRQKEEEEEQDDDHHKQIRVAFLSALRASPDSCILYTGERTFELLTLKYEYLNAKGALDRLNWWRPDYLQKPQNPRNAGRSRTLSNFESYVFYRCVLRSGDLARLAVNFGISRSTAQRTYLTLLNAVVFIMSSHQPWPTAKAAWLATPSKTRVELMLDDGAAVFMADAVERQIEKPSDPGLQSATYSDYKGCTTLKAVAVASLNGYMCEFSRGYPGSYRDNRIMEHSKVGMRIASGDDVRKSVLLFDKGFTQLHVVEQYSVLVLTPNGKRHEQFNFTKEASHNKSVANNRAGIEKLFGHCRTYHAFDNIIRLTEVDTAELISEAVRCETNLYAVPHDWTLTADTQSLMEKITGGVEDHTSANDDEFTAAESD